MAGQRPAGPLGPAEADETTQKTCRIEQHNSTSLQSRACRARAPASSVDVFFEPFFSLLQQMPLGAYFWSQSYAELLTA